MTCRRLRPKKKAADDYPVTVHGFRSSFRDWVSDATTFPTEAAEIALAHLTGSEVERAYRRSDQLEKRVPMMAAWAGYIRPATGAKVVKLGRRPGSSRRRATGASQTSRLRRCLQDAARFS